MLFLHYFPALSLLKCVSIVPFSMRFSLFRTRTHEIQRWNNIETRFKLCDLSAIFFSEEVKRSIWNCKPESLFSVRKTFLFPIQSLDFQTQLIRWVILHFIVATFTLLLILLYFLAFLFLSILFLMQKVDVWSLSCFHFVYLLYRTQKLSFQTQRKQSASSDGFMTISSLNEILIFSTGLAFVSCSRINFSLYKHIRNVHMGNQSKSWTESQEQWQSDKCRFRKVSDMKHVPKNILKFFFF